MSTSYVCVVLEPMSGASLADTIESSICMAFQLKVNCCLKWETDKGQVSILVMPGESYNVVFARFCELMGVR